MNKKIIFLPLLLTTTPLLISNDFLTNEKKYTFVKNIKEQDESTNRIKNNNSNTITVSNYNEWLNLANKNFGKGDKIIITNDIDFKDFKPSDAFQIATDQIEITGKNDSGKDFKFYNKPIEYVFSPIIISSRFSTGLYLHNLIFEGMGTIFDSMQQISHDHDYDVAGIKRDNSLFFENIVIEDNNIVNQNFIGDIPEYLSLFIGDVNLYESGNVEADNAVTFNNITIRNNHIENNIFSGNLLARQNISFSWLTSIVYDVCGDSHHHHHGFVNYENINIENNTFFGNDITQAEGRDIDFSFGNINGIFSGVSNWTGSKGNSLSLDGILVQDNLIEKPKNISEKNFSYAELISQPNKVSKDNQWTSIAGIKNVYSINNAVFNSFNKDNYLKSDFFSNDNKIAISLSNKNDNTWNKENTNNVFFIVPESFNPQGKEVKFNIISGKSTNEVGNSNVKSLDLLTTNNSSFEVIKTGLQKHYGIYGVANSFIKDKDRNNTNKIKAFITSQENQGYGIISDLVVEGDAKKQSYQKMKITWKFHQAKEDNVVDKRNPYLL